MADKHPYPYTPSQGAINQIVGLFRKSFPQSVTSDTLKKLGIAPNNESRPINVLKFLGFLDSEGNRTDVAVKIFTIHDDKAFAEEFGKQVAVSYSELFELRQDESWTLSQNDLIGFFRGSDGSSDVVGKKQAQTFQALAGIAGHGGIPAVKATNLKARTPVKRKGAGSAKEKPAENSVPKNGHSTINGNSKRDIGLTVRIEINLPADGDQETYDRIFKSIRENLLNE